MSNLKDQNQNFKLRTYRIEKGEKRIITINQSGEYVIELLGEGAEAQILGAFIGNEKDSFDVRTIQFHKAKNTKSDLLIKTALFQNSKFKYRGLIKIEKGADGVDAYQKNENLILGSYASVDSEPSLEIKANSVRCTHGVTTGQIDEEVLYYLRARGLSEKKAKNLLLIAFFEDLFSKSKDKELIIKIKKLLKDEKLEIKN